MSPGILELKFMGSVVWFICSANCVLYSTGSGVKRVHVVLYGMSMRLFLSVHVCIPVGMIECLLLLCFW